LTLAGDIEPPRAFALAEQYFGGIPARPRPEAVVANGALTHSMRLLLEDRVELPRLYIAWHGPAMFGEHDAELDLAADLVAHGKTSRLYKRLVYEKQIATTAAPRVTLGELYEIVIETLGELAHGKPAPEELERARAQTDAQFIYRLQTIGGFGGKSDQLNAYNVFRGDPGYFAADRSRYERASPDTIAAALRLWIIERPHVALSVVPKGSRQLALAQSAEVSVS
jgi:zinc protease